MISAQKLSENILSNTMKQIHSSSQGNSGKMGLVIKGIVLLTAEELSLHRTMA